MDPGAHTCWWKQKLIACKHDKLGFTCSVLSSMSGELILMKMIWKGKTAEVHACVTKPHPKVFQQYREDLHYKKMTSPRWTSPWDCKDFLRTNWNSFVVNLDTSLARSRDSIVKLIQYYTRFKWLPDSILNPMVYATSLKVTG